MMSTLFWFVVGAIVGWNVPQPAWSKVYTDKIVAVVKGWFA